MRDIDDYTALGHRAYGVDDGSYPLGSCTMKYNPKRHEPRANLEGFAHAPPSARCPASGSCSSTSPNGSRS
ncbi:hypothetical protein WME77_20005 [Sorangium sp. So ce764]|uniref:hypothetical protein n=1 Tax=Sorangium sp. So ce764 TaxID=3133320 RepID=UPI003F6213DF